VSQNSKEACQASAESLSLHREGLGGALSLKYCFSTDTLKCPETFHVSLMKLKEIFLVGPAVLETGMCQEKPEHLVSAPARPFPKLPHSTSLFSLKFHKLLMLLPGCPPQRASGCLPAALPAGAMHVDKLPCTQQSEPGSNLAQHQPPS